MKCTANAFQKQTSISIPMKQAYLIIAHDNFEHLSALISVLDCQDVFIYLYIDAKAHIPEYIRDFQAVNPLTILHDKRVDWGNQSLVIAELDLFSKAFENDQIEWFHLISGTDFPIRPIEEINQFFEAALGVDGFMESEPIPTHLKPRMELYHFHVRRPTPGSISQWLGSKFLSLQAKCGIKRKSPEGKPFMYGSSWSDLRRRPVELLLSRRKEILKSTKYTSIADEIYKQTFLQNDNLNIINDNLRYIDWSERRPSPKTLTIADFESIASSAKLFARKFDIPESEALRRQIIEHIGKKNTKYR